MELGVVGRTDGIGDRGVQLPVRRLDPGADVEPLPATCVDWLARTTPPLLWPDRLEAKP